MTDTPSEPDAADSETDDTSPSIFDQQPGVDWALAQLITWADHFDFQPGLTLFVGGLVVSGFLVSGRAFFKGIAHEIKSEAGSGNADEPNVSDVIADNMEKFEFLYPALEEGNESKPLFPAYIHLREARVYNSGRDKPLPGNRGVFWRGKLTSVDGFNFGILSTG